MFTIKGYAKPPSPPPPRVSGTPTVSGATLIIPFSKRLHPGSVPPPEAFEVVVGDGAGVHPSAVDLDTSRTQRRVTLTLAAPVARGETVEVRYTRPAALGERLRDFAGNAVASFTQTVANDSLGGRPVADAGADLTVFADSVVTLDGSGSSDPDGDELAYAWTQVSGGPVTLAGADTATPSSRAPGSPGELVFRLTVTDPGGLSASDAVTVTVESGALLKQTVKRTLAAVGRGTLSSALDNIGMRFLASVPSGQLTLAGKTLAFGAGGSPGLAHEGPCEQGHRSVGGAFGQTGFFDNSREGCAPVAQNRGAGAAEWLAASAFSLTLGVAEGAEVPSATRWSVWGRGDLGSFSGRPEPGMRYEGDLRTGWLGVDARAGAWVAGLALSHGTGEADYSFDGGDSEGSGQGRLETTLTALYPYGRWTVSDGLELHGMLGAGRGKAEHRLVGGARETSDLSMWMGSVGLRHALHARAGRDLSLRAEASLARLETDSGPDYVDGLTADSWRTRLGLEASRRIELDGDAALTPFVETAARRG